MPSRLTPPCAGRCFILAADTKESPLPAGVHVLPTASSWTAVGSAVWSRETAGCILLLRLRLDGNADLVAAYSNPSPPFVAPPCRYHRSYYWGYREAGGSWSKCQDNPRKIAHMYSLYVPCFRFPSFPIASADECVDRVNKTPFAIWQPGRCNLLGLGINDPCRANRANVCSEV